MNNRYWVLVLIPVEWDDDSPFQSSKRHSCQHGYGPAVSFQMNAFMTTAQGAILAFVVLDGKNLFSCLSLGHVADVSGALDQLTDLRRLGGYNNGQLKHISSRDLERCSRTNTDIKRGPTLREKLHPPGKLLTFVNKQSKHSKLGPILSASVVLSNAGSWGHGFYLTRHAPKVYETSLQQSTTKP